MNRAHRTMLSAALAAIVLLPVTGSAAARETGAGQSTVSQTKDDPAAGQYKKAYELILSEQWTKARKAFRDLADQYPKSEYRDDAEYWIAYTWRETDQDRAMKAYSEFLRNYKSSAYFDDALADLDQMMAHSLAVAVPVAGVPLTGVPRTPTASTAPRATPALPATPPMRTWTMFPDDSNFAMTVRSLPAPAIAPVIKMRHLGRLIRTPYPGRPMALYDDEKLDDETKIRLEALYAVSSGEDEKSFGAIRTIAADHGEKAIVRVAAMEALCGYRRHDALPVFVEIARADTNEEMQLYAIESIGNAAPDREKAFDALMKIYTSVPAAKVEKRKMVFYSIAELGSDRSVDFLADVAKSGTDKELRREAVYYLGTIGGEKARAVLIDLLDGK